MDNIIYLIIFGTIGYLIGRKKIMVHPIFIFLALIAIVILSVRSFNVRLGTAILDIFDVIFVASMALFIALQVVYNKKLAEFTIMPSAFFTLYSAKTFARIAEVEPPSLIRQKLKTILVIKNNSKFPVYFKIKIIFKVDGKIMNISPHYWDETPLRLLPGCVRFPDVVHLSRALEDDKNKNDEDSFNKKISGTIKKAIIADIEYSCVPVLEPDIKYKTVREEWRFDLNDFIWIAPHGTRDENISLNCPLDKPRRVL